MLQEIVCIYSLVESFQFRNKKRVNDLIAKIYGSNLSINDFFNISKEKWTEIKELLEITREEIPSLAEAKKKLVSNSFFIEQLNSKGIELLHIYDEEYPKILKENLLFSELPTILYAKGNLKLLNKKSISIVGSRDASETSIKFAKKIAELEVSNGDVIVSGFAKGIDKVAFESSIEYDGNTIAVIPEGINTFRLPKTYYKNFINGNILILSTFPPNASWTAGYAMERNKYIYALGKEIYVAQSDFKKGGTWSGAIEGIKKNRTVFVRKPESENEIGNLELIKAGGIAMNKDGKLEEEFTNNLQKEKKMKEEFEFELKKKIETLLKNSFKSLSAKEIKNNLNLDFKIDILKGIENLKIQDGKIKKYYISENLEIDELKNLSNMIGKTSQKKMF